MKKKLSIMLVIITVILAVYFVFFPVKVANPSLPEPALSGAADNPPG